MSWSVSHYSPRHPAPTFALWQPVAALSWAGGLRYMRLARGLHPDKVAQMKLSSDQALVCAAVFGHLSVKYEEFKRRVAKAEARAEARAEEERRPGAAWGPIDDGP